MFRRFIVFILCSASVAALWCCAHPGHAQRAKDTLTAIWQRQFEPLDPKAVELAVSGTVNNSRGLAHLHPLVTDNDLRAWLGGELKHSPADLDEVLRDAKEHFPSYSRLAILSNKGLTVSDISDGAAEWNQARDAEFNSVAVVAAPIMAKFGISCVILAGQKLPPFSPEALVANPNGVFFTVCSHCGRGHTCQIGHHNQSISLECPECHRVYAMLATDTHGQLQYVNEYLKHYQPAAHFPKRLSRLAEMLLIWGEVGRTCKYEVNALALDAQGSDTTDAWQSAAETQNRQAGDCKDTAVLVADWLISRGFEARVAVGRYAERGGHAWVVVRLDGKQYLLEATLSSPDIYHPPLVQDVGARYIPDLLFDYDSIYVRQQPGERFDGDYWSTDTWNRVVQRTRPQTSHPVAASVKNQALPGARTSAASRANTIPSNAAARHVSTTGGNS